MTEAEWLACRDPRRLLDGVSANHRRLRLFACAECRRQLHNVVRDEFRNALDVAERYAAGAATDAELSAASRATMYGSARRRANRAQSPTLGLIHWLVQPDVSMLSAASLAVASKPAARQWQCQVLRDIFGNPFRPVAFDPDWRTDTAVALARRMYESRDFTAMPILADALQDAGCDRDDILAHCRDANATHVRGCWVVDLVLGKG